MRILLDLQGAQTDSRFRGIGRQSMLFAQAMARNAGNHEIWLAVNNAFPAGIDDIHAAFDGLIPAERIRKFNTFRNVSWRNEKDAWYRDASELMWEAFLDGIQPDIVHVSSLFEGAQGGAVSSIGKLPKLKTTTSVTLHDLIPLVNKGVYLGVDWVRSWYMDKVESLKRADLLLSVSQHAREEALQLLDINPERVVNMSSAISPHFQPVLIGQAQKAMLHERFGIKDRYVMYSGAMDARKNADGLLKAFSMLGDTLLRDTQLVIAGKVDNPAALDDLSAKLGIADRIVFTGYISDDDLITLYSAAAVYVFPSLHEGFGLPALEAMACGAPTIGSNTTSVPEVIGCREALFDPHNPVAIADVIRRVLEDNAFSESLRAHGKRQATRFSWEKTAHTALEAMESVVATRPSRIRCWPGVGQTMQATYQNLIKAVATLDVSF